MDARAGADVSAVIIHTGGFQHLEKCLTTLFGTAGRCTIEAIVVDNRSGTPGLKELVGRFSEARIVSLEQRSGYPSATNRGIREAQGRHVLWCNDDLIFQPGAVDVLADFLDRNPEYGAAAPQLLNPDGTFQPCFSRVHMSLGNLVIERLNLTGYVPSAWTPSRSWLGHEHEEADVAVAGGACMLIRRTALDAVGGGIDERFFLYAEEFDLSYRLNRAGWKIRYLPEARIIHVGSATTAPGSAAVPTHLRWVLQGWRSRFAYLRKHSGATTEAVYAAVFAATAAPKWLLTSVRGAWARLRGDVMAAEGWRARAALHSFAARMALNSSRRDAARYPEYPPR